jgi:hypothetical protein
MRNGNWSACKNFIINEKMDAKVMMILGVVLSLSPLIAPVFYLSSLCSCYTDEEIHIFGMIACIPMQYMPTDLVKIWKNLICTGQIEGPLTYQ